MTRVGPNDPARSRPIEGDAAEGVSSPVSPGRTPETGEGQGGGVDDRYETATAEPERPAAEAGEQGGVNVVAAFSASRAQGRDKLAQDLEALKSRLAVAIRALPDIAEEAAERALATSAERILDSLDAGRIDLEEAHRAEHMLAEIVGALLAIEQGRFTVSSFDMENSPGYVAYNVHTTDGDTIRVAVRSTGSEDGQARLKIYNVNDDGQAVPASHRVMVRFDLDGSHVGDEAENGEELKSTIDVQLGHGKYQPGLERLNKRIHGVLLDEDGQPVLNRLGNTVADHHFTDGLPDHLNDSEVFKTFVEGFLDDLVGHKRGDP